MEARTAFQPTLPGNSLTLVSDPPARRECEFPLAVVRLLGSADVVLNRSDNEVPTSPIVLFLSFVVDSHLPTPACIPSRLKYDNRETHEGAILRLASTNWLGRAIQFRRSSSIWRIVAICRSTCSGKHEGGGF